MKPRILVCEDEPTLVELFDEFLSDAGYEVTCSLTCLPIPRVAALEPDLIIVDYMMGAHSNNGHYLRQLRESPETAGIPLLLCTAARQREASLETFLQRERITVVHKPFEIEEFVRTVRRLLAP